MLNQSRRKHIFSNLAVLASTLISSYSWSAQSRKLFDASSTAEAIRTLAEKDPLEPSNRLLIDLPEISVDPGRVAIRVRSELPGTDMMLIMSTSTVPSVIAQFNIPVGTEADIYTLIKVPGTSAIQLIARAGGKLYSAQKEVKIALPLNTKLLME